jgi:hypothetical protein
MKEEKETKPGQKGNHLNLSERGRGRPNTSLTGGFLSLPNVPHQ